jgi:WG containing repeat
MASISSWPQTKRGKGLPGRGQGIREMNKMRSNRSLFSKCAVIATAIWILASYDLAPSAPPADFSEGFAAIKVGDKWGFMNRKGEYPIPPQFDEVGFFSEGLAAVKVGTKWGFIDGKGKWVIPAGFDGVAYFSEGLAPAKIGERWGFINKKGETVIKPQFQDEPTPFFFGEAMVTIGGRKEYIDGGGRRIKNPAKEKEKEASDDSGERSSLYGLPGVYVLVESLNLDMEKDGLTKDQLRKEVETQLRNAGIRVLTREEKFKTAGNPQLYVNVNLLKSSSPFAYAYSVEISLEQEVALVRKPNMRTVATTWSQGSVGIVGIANLRAIRETVKGRVDHFIHDYFAANSK